MKYINAISNSNNVFLIYKFTIVSVHIKQRGWVSPHNLGFSIDRDNGNISSDGKTLLWTTMRNEIRYVTLSIQHGGKTDNDIILREDKLTFQKNQNGGY